MSNFEQLLKIDCLTAAISTSEASIQDLSAAAGLLARAGATLEQQAEYRKHIGEAIKQRGILRRELLQFNDKLSSDLGIPKTKDEFVISGQGCGVNDF